VVECRGSADGNGGRPDSAAWQSSSLAGRTVRYWPWPFDEDPAYGRLQAGAGLNELALTTEEGLEAAQRNRDEGIRLLYVGFTRARDRLVLAHRPDECCQLEQLPRLGQLLPSDAGSGEYAISGVSTQYVVRELTPSVDDKAVAGTDSVIQRWLPTVTAARKEVRPPRWLRPSDSGTEEGRMPDVAITWLPGGPFFPEGLAEDREADLGNAVHAFLAALPSLTGADEARCEQTARNCLDAYRVGNLIAPAVVVAFGRELCTWIAAT
jgi:ATP-dependent helicase/nuclease subunit A